MTRPCVIKNSPLLLLAFILTACEGTVYALGNAEATASRKIAGFSDRVNPQPQHAKRTAEPRYCYIVMGDTVCYREPLSGENDSRLVGYQEPLTPVGPEYQDAYRTRVTRMDPRTPVAITSAPQPIETTGSRSSTLETVTVPPPARVIVEDTAPIRLMN